MQKFHFHPNLYDFGVAAGALALAISVLSAGATASADTLVVHGSNGAAGTAQSPNGASGGDAAAVISGSAASYNSAAAYGGMGGAGSIISMNPIDEGSGGWSGAATATASNGNGAVSPSGVTSMASATGMLAGQGDPPGAVGASSANASATNEGGPATSSATATGGHSGGGPSPSVVDAILGGDATASASSYALGGAASATATATGGAGTAVQPVAGPVGVEGSSGGSAMAAAVATASGGYSATVVATANGGDSGGIPYAGAGGGGLLGTVWGSSTSGAVSVTGTIAAGAASFSYAPPPFGSAAIQGVTEVAKNAIGGNTTGTLSLTQSVTAGAGSSGYASGSGGYAQSVLQYTVSESSQLNVTANATGGAGGGIPVTVSPAAGGAADAVASADNSAGGATAIANATGGSGGGARMGGPGARGAATADAAATTASASGIAVATASATPAEAGGTGGIAAISATAQATGGANGTVTNSVTESLPNANLTQTVQANPDGATPTPGSLTGQHMQGLYSSLAPSAGAISNATAGSSAVQTAFTAPTTTALGMFTLVSGTSSESLGNLDIQARSTWIANSSLSTGGRPLFLGMINPEAGGAGTVSFTLTVDGATAISKEFTSFALASDWFTDNVISLGTPSGSGSLTVGIAFTVDAGAAGGWFGASGLLGLGQQPLVAAKSATLVEAPVPETNTLSILFVSVLSLPLISRRSARWRNPAWRK